MSGTGEDANGMSATRKRVGQALLALSVVAWIAVAALPLLDLPARDAAAWAGGLLVGGEIAFIAAASLLGKDAWAAIRAWFRTPR